MTQTAISISMTCPGTPYGKMGSNQLDALRAPFQLATKKTKEQGAGLAAAKQSAEYIFK